jgi:hypothetical protein
MEYITPAIPKLMKMYMYFAASGAIGSCHLIILYNPILSIILKATLYLQQALGTHLPPSMERNKWDFNSISEENAKNIHNCSVADKLSLYKSSNKNFLLVGINKQRQLA